MKNTDIAIVGMSCHVPGADNINDFWNNLKNGVDSIVDAPEDRIPALHFDENLTGISKFYCRRGGFINNTTFDPLSYGMLPLAVQGMDPTHLLALKLVYQALEDASVFKKNISLKKGSIIMGRGNYGGIAIHRIINMIETSEQIAEILRLVLPDLPTEDIEKVKQKYQADNGRFQADTISGVIPNLITSMIANKLDMHGTAYTVDAACASALIAIEHSVEELLSGRSDISIAGGIFLEQNSTFWSVFTQLGAISHKEQISPFSEDADGLIVAEAGGFVVLKKLEKAIADNDRIYSVIKGVGVSSDGSGYSVMVPSVKGQKIAIEKAWKKAKMNPKKVGYIEAHGTATVIGDRAEIQSLTEFFGDGTQPKIPIGSVKSNIGHAMPAAGIIGLIKASLSIYHRQIPATLHCEKPAKHVEKSRFAPVQKLMDWDESKLPLIAGVNAFGFGGINVHVIMEAHGEKAMEQIAEKAPFDDEVVVITAPSKEALLEALDKREFSSASAGDYRLVLFNPTDERIQKAKTLISKDKPWKGRQDIWFTNKPLLKDGGKLAFLFPGYDPGSNPEIESISKYFNVPIQEYTESRSELLSNASRLHKSSIVIDTVFKDLDIKPDMNAGHSLGEWFAVNSSGLASDESVTRMLNSMDLEKYQINDVYFIALGCGADRVKPWLDTIPDLYLSNDNCPSQALLCGTQSALDALIAELKREQIYYQVLTFQSGFHSPFIKDKLHLLDESLKGMKIMKPEIPVWSATTLELYPTKIGKFKNLAIKHLTETVRFRELIEKLYKQENARVFIQIGSGSLNGFVDDTLKGEAYSVISTCTHLKTTLEQMRRVIALLFIEGKEVDLSVIGVQEGILNTLSDKEMILNLGVPIIKKFPILEEWSATHKGAKLSPASIDNMFPETNHPIMNALNENIKEMVSMQKDIAQLFKQKGVLNNNNANKSVQQSVSTVVPTTPTPALVQPATVAAPTPPTKVENKGEGYFEEHLNISLETHPYIMGHSLIKQPENWPFISDLNPVIPMTMTFELLAEAAHKQDVSKKVLNIGPISVFQWMNVHEPFVKTITGSWKTKDTILLGIKNYASGEVKLGNTYPEPPAEYSGEIDLGKNIPGVKIPSVKKIYDLHMFHGPSYQGIQEVTHVTKKGLRGYIKKADGKGSLLDNIGQLFGLYLQLILEKDSVSFPVKVGDIQFYQDMNDQDGLFECICLLDSLDDEFAVGKIIIKREGKVWCTISGWRNRRFEIDMRLWDVLLSPLSNTIADEIAPNIFYFYNAYNMGASWDFIMKKYLNTSEKEHYNNLFLNKRREYLISRIVMKDVLRMKIAPKTKEEYFPIQFTVKYDERGKPYAYDLLKKDVTYEVSISHKGTEAVATTSDKPIGIDIETIEDRGDGFIQLSFSKKELELMKGKETNEWATRFWVAKEAYAKMVGTGLEGNPRKYEVEKIDGETLTIQGVEIKTIRHKDNLIIGWTQ